MSFSAFDAALRNFYTKHLRPFLFSRNGRIFLLRERGGLENAAFWGSNKLTVNRLPLITSLCEELSPRGEALTLGYNFNLTSIDSHTLATFPEGESKGAAEFLMKFVKREQFFRKCKNLYKLHYFVY